MDIGAYARIEDLQSVADKNGINISRLRGYRLMKDEKPFSKASIQEMLEEAILDAAEEAVRSTPSFAINYWCIDYSEWTDMLRDYYLVYDKNKKKVTGIRWERIHGKKRKNLKYLIKQAKKRVLKNSEMWNRYAGKEDVLYIHAKLGSSNWTGIKASTYESEPWYLDSCDDLWDTCYCDIYARIE